MNLVFELFDFEFLINFLWGKIVLLIVTVFFQTIFYIFCSHALLCLLSPLLPPPQAWRCVVTHHVSWMYNIIFPQFFCFKLFFAFFVYILNGPSTRTTSSLCIFWLTNQRAVMLDNFMLRLHCAWQITSEAWACASLEHMLTMITCYNSVSLIKNKRLVYFH